MSTSDWREYKTPKLILSAHLWMHWRSAGFLKRTRTSMLWNSKSWAFLALLPKNSWLFFFSFAFSNKHVRAVCQVGLCWEEKQADKMVKRCCWATSKSNTLHPDCVGGVCVFLHSQTFVPCREWIGLCGRPRHHQRHLCLFNDKFTDKLCCM